MVSQALVAGSGLGRSLSRESENHAEGISIMIKKVVITKSDRLTIVPLPSTALTNAQ